MLQDFRYAVRSLLKTPGVAVVIVLTLALGIGANTAIFSFVRGILLRPLPYDDPTRLVLLKRDPRSSADPIALEAGLLAADFRELQPQLRTLRDTTTYTLDSATVTRPGSADLAVVAIVSPNFFSLLGSPAALGRSFTPVDLASGSGRLAVVSHRYWQTRLGGAPDIIGQSVTLNDRPFTVVGIMPADFDFPREAQFWVTPAADVPEAAIGEPRDFGGRGNDLRTVIGRLAPGVSISQAQQELGTLVGRLPNPNSVQRTGHLVTMRHQTIGEIRPVLAMLLACVGLVLLIACLNVANLMLSRAAARTREIGVRRALGAARWHIIRQLLTESLTLAAVGGAVGVGLSTWGLDLLVAVAPATIPRLDTVRIDLWVLGFAAALTMATGVASGLAPVLATTRTDLSRALRDGGRAGSAGGIAHRLRTFLVASEVAISLVLLVAAGLLARSLGEMRSFAWGFDPAHIVSARVAFLSERYRDPAARTVLTRSLLEKLGQTPGFTQAGASLDRIGHSWIQFAFAPEGRTYANPGERPVANFHLVTPDYLRTVGIALQQGRGFTVDDKVGSPLFCIVDTSLATRYFPDGALGRRLLVPTPTGEAYSQIIGVVAPVKSDGPTGQVRPDLYLPFLQVLPNSFFAHVRTGIDPGIAGAMIRRAVAEIDPEVPVTDVASLAQITALPATALRFPLGLFGGFAALALLLAAIGIYAVTAFNVTQRTREIGIRIALGAQPDFVIREVLHHGLRPVLVGLIGGVLAAGATAFAMRALLYGISPLDPRTFVVVPALLLVIAGLACWLPARRAAHVDPLVALRAE